MGGAKIASRRSHPCILGPWLVPSKGCLHEGMNNQINYSWTSPLWPHEAFWYPILMFSPSVSAHPAHYFFTRTQPLTSFSPVLLKPSAPVLWYYLAKPYLWIIATVHLYAHGWELVSKITQLYRPVLHIIWVSDDSVLTQLLSLYHSCFLLYVETQDTRHPSTLSLNLFFSPSLFQRHTSSCSRPCFSAFFQVPCDLISTLPFSSPFLLCLIL